MKNDALAWRTAGLTSPLSVENHVTWNGKAVWELAGEEQQDFMESTRKGISSIFFEEPE